MASRRFRRKDLKRPDQFVSSGRRLLVWAQAQRTRLGWGLAALTAVALAAGLLLSVRGARLRQANQELGQALAEFRSGRYGDAATQLAEVAQRWQATPAGYIARLYAANADLLADNLDAATLHLLQLVEGAQGPSYLQQQATVGLAFALEKKADLGSAAARYHDASLLQGPYTALALLSAARCRQQLGEQGEARKLYERFVREFPAAPEADVANAKIGELGAGPRAP